MFEEVISRDAKEILNSLSHVLDDFYMAGETALSLQLGHRKSFDFDFFTHLQFDLSLTSIIC